mmetsp:Transcript_12748/g.25488  ORF Transcript_12748/g.25488 Transcript_12748/m.25488 type:complete len:1239 (-) Transcript_12748:194-3910(-)
MSKLPPLSLQSISHASDGDDDEEYLSASSNIAPSPPPTRPISQRLQERQQQAHHQRGQLPPPPPPQQQGSSVPTDVTASVASLKPSPPKPALNNRAVTAAGSGQKPPMPKRNKSVGFSDDLKITTSPPELHGAGLPRPGIISQRKPSTDGASHASQRSNISSVSGSTHVKSNYSLDEIISSQFENEAVTHILAVLENEELREMDKLDSMKKGGSEYSSALLGERIDEQGESDGSNASSEEAGMTNYSEDEDEDNGVIPPPPPPPRDSGSLSSSPSTYSAPSHVRNDSFLQRVHMQNDQPQYQYDPYSPGSRSEWSSPGRKKSNRYGISSAGKSSAYLSYVTDDSALAEDAKSKGSITSGVSIERELTVENKGKHNNESIHNSSRIRVQHNADDDWDGNQGQSSLTSDKAKKAEDAHDTATLADRLRSLQLKRSNFSGRLSFQSSNASAASSVAAGALGAEPESNTDKLLDALSRADQTKNQQWLRQLRLEYDHLIAPKIPTLEKSISHTLFFIIFPCLAVSAILFYLVDNPMIGDSNTSWSWLVLFLGVRQMVIFEFARVGEIFWIEILALRSSFFNMVVGPYLALAVIQSRGWPYICIFWPVLNFCFLYGNHEFAKHWLFWQDMLDIFNEVNPVDGVTDDNFYFRLLMVMIFIGVTVSLKRLTIALYLGRRTVEHFGVELEKLMAKMILIGEVANLAKSIENRNALIEGPLSPLNHEIDDEKLVRFREFVQNDGISDVDSPGRPGRKSAMAPTTHPPPPPDSSSPLSPSPVQLDATDEGPRNSPGHLPRSSPDQSAQGSTGSKQKKDYFSSATNAKLIYLLSEWEEPEIVKGNNSNVSVHDLVQFRKAVSYMDDKYRFSHAFGPAKTRVLCVESAQKVYDRLMLSAEQDSPTLPFSVFAVLAMDANGELVESKMKSLIRLLRPDRNGSLMKLDFVKSIDAVYKQLRLLRASIANSAQIDLAFERIVNFLFYFFVVVIALAIVGINIWTPFLSINAFVLTFSILYKDAASKYFEGLLLIFNRRPYDIGDRIATSAPMKDTSGDGSSTWFVDKVTLFTTTVRFATTNEVATYSNGSLAPLRIINANRSPKAILYLVIKFGLETPFQRIKVFRTAVENFINARPREWVGLIGFRATRVEADMGFIEYKIVGEHREAWQNIGAILESKADLASFCLEVTKKLGMRYESPPMPVNLSANSSDLRQLFEGEVNDDDGWATRKRTKSVSADDLKDVAAMFPTET